MTSAALVATIGHAAAVAEAARLQQAYSDLSGRYEALLRDCHPAYSAGHHTLVPQSRAAQDVAAERRRQIVEEGWTASHDDAHTDGALSQAAAAYALVGSLSDEWRERLFPSSWGTVIWAMWPGTWSRQWFKPKDRRRDLVRACALLIAEIERVDRAAIVQREAGQ
ncbi:hypothetical protein [Methylobacterium sp. Leaf100]|uniref:hypothetical protein n=1 Tax=Methylobacterium sp. Leaf100 TaxID=1736252 RepID=UPI0006F7E06F|nr:hypothetical protein [Methylobacterium sp. Leaf100]KQP36670.1 hypothetical protein ASF25_01565 [Methylobacterium sp. Leaf100]